jgi:hypothetical protein
MMRPNDRIQLIETEICRVYVALKMKIYAVKATNCVPKEKNRGNSSF